VVPDAEDGAASDDRWLTVSEPAGAAGDGLERS
jgi:hypothetical protein